MRGTGAAAQAQVRLRQPGPSLWRRGSAPPAAVAVATPAPGGRAPAPRAGSELCVHRAHRLVRGAARALARARTSRLRFRSGSRQLTCARVPASPPREARLSGATESEAGIRALRARRVSALFAAGPRAAA